MKKHRLSTVACALTLALLILPISAQEEADPAKAEVLLEERAGWQTSLVFDAGCGVWCVKPFQLYPELAAPEIVAADDRGRATILISYSGKWTPKATLLDGKWLAPMAQGDFALGEGVLLLGGAGGRLYETRPRTEGQGDVLLRASFPGEEIHTILTVPDRNGDGHDRALIFLKSGRVFEYRCPHETERRRGSRESFVVEEIARVEGRVRDALLWAYSPTEDAAIVFTVSRAGQLVRRVLEMPEGTAIRFTNEVVLDEPQGLGRVARGVGTFADRLYVTRDDGVYLVVARDDDGKWRREVVHRGEQGPRGIVAGRFDEDPEVETLAIFGYSGKVELLSRKGDAPFAAKTLFIDRDKGHWLARAELDGRNETDEIIASGYSGRVVLISRQRAGKKTPTDALEDDADSGETGRVEGAAERAVGSVGPAAASRRAPFRIGVRKLPAARDIDPLRYGGGFYTKTATYLTLLRRNDEGRLVPGLARTWRFEDEGRTWIFDLDTRLRLQDGSKLDARRVREQYLEVLEDPAHRWLGFARYTRAIEAPNAGRLIIRLDRPWALEEEMVAVNPFGVRAPASHRDGRFIAPLGSGPLRPQVEDERRGRLVYVDDREHPVFELVEVAKRDGLWSALASGEVDTVIEGWEQDLLADHTAAYLGEPLRVSRAPGSSVVYLSFNLEAGPMAKVGLRRRLAHELDRTGFEDGRRRDCRFWSADPIHEWPRPSVRPESIDVRSGAPPWRAEQVLRLVVNRDEPWQIEAAEFVERALDGKAAGALLEIALLPASDYAAAVTEGRFDILIERTWGLPYDPFLSLVARFDPVEEKTASSRLRTGIHPDLRAAVRRAATEPDHSSRLAAYADAQTVMTREFCILPLYTPDRFAFVRESSELSIAPGELSPSPYALPLESMLRGADRR